MSLQSSTMNTTHVLDNEIVKASDFEYAFENIVTNVSKAVQMFLESTQDFVINGKVLPDNGMNVKVSPIFGVCKSTGISFGRTETASMEYGFDESQLGRVDIIEVQGDWLSYDNQQRAFNDPDTDTQTYQYVDTKRLTYPTYRIKQGVEGSSVAPEHDAGWVKLAEVVIRANASTITAADIKNITSDISGLENSEWTVEKDATYDIGYISAVNARFRVAHNEDGTHKEDSIDSSMLDIGIGEGQVNGNILPVGASVNIPTEYGTVSANDSILSVFAKLATIVTYFYDNYKKYGTYGFKGELTVSELADSETNVLTNPIKFYAAGDGTALIKIGNNTVLSIDANGKLSTNGYQATANNHLITKVITDALDNRVFSLETNVNYILNNIDPSSAVNKGLSKFSFGANLKAATTTNITLANSQTLDGVVVEAGDLVLVKDQTNLSENGIYEVSNSGTWTRGAYLTDDDIAKKFFVILNGTTHKGSVFVTTKDVFDVDGASAPSNEITFEKTYFKVTANPSSIPMRDTYGLLRGGKAPNNDTTVATNLRNITDKTILASVALLADVITPVGFVYTQFPQQLNPVELGLFGTWKEIGSYNGAFFRSSNCPRNLFSVDGINFYRDLELTQPIIFDNLGTVTPTNNTFENTKGDTVRVYEGDWIEGNADAWIEKTDSLNVQNDMIKTHTVSGGNHRHGYTATGSTSGSQSTYDTGSGATRTNYTHYSGDLTLTYGNATDNPETRPKNFTIKIWKRTS